MPIVRTDDNARLYYWAVGRGPVAVMLLHGWAGAGSGHSWRYLLRELHGARFNTIIPDLRGHGGSSVGNEGFSTRRIAEDIFQIARHAGAECMVTIAYSMSGKWAQAMTLMHPEIVNAQVLIAPAPLEALHLPPELPAQWIENTRDREKFGSFIQSFAKETVAPSILDDYFFDASTTPEPSLLQTLRICSEENITSNVRSLSTPTLICGGRWDSMFTPEFLNEYVAKKFAGSRLEELDCGHEIPIERPRELAALISDFCIEQLPGTNSRSLDEDASVA